MEYISMERAVEFAVQANILMEEKYPHGGNKLSWASDENFQALCNAAIADYLKGVGDGVGLPTADYCYGYTGYSYTETQVREAIAAAPRPSNRRD